MKYPFHICTSLELDVLYKLFHITTKDEVKLKKKIGKLLLPLGGVLQNGINYDQFIHKIAANRNLKLSMQLSIYEKEKLLFEKITQQNFAAMSSSERENYAKQLEFFAQESGFSNAEKASLTSLTAIGADQLSGFGVYLLASSTVGAITSLVGITLPFAFYTTMSSAVSVAIGPLGLFLAAIPLYKTFKNVQNWQEALAIIEKGFNNTKKLTLGNFETAEIIFSYFASLRIIKLQEYDARSQDEKHLIGDIEKDIINQIKEIEVESDKSRSLMSERELIQNELKKVQERLDATDEILQNQYAVTREAGAVLTNLNKKKLVIHDRLTKIKIAKNNLLQ